MVKVFRKVVLVTIPFIALSCAQVEDPLTGQQTFTLLSTEQEIQIGRKYVPQAINENEGQYPDKEVRNYIKKVGYKIAETAPRKVDYQFYIVNSKEINACKVG